MGFGFVILLHLIFLLVISFTIAIISGLITFFTADKIKRKRKIFLSVISPFLLLFSFYFLCLLGSIIVSEYKKVDLGIGDSWYAPLNDSCQILMIDLPEQAYIEFKGTTLISDVAYLQQINTNLYGKTANRSYFKLNLTNNNFKEFSTVEDLKANENIKELKFEKAEVFYENLKEKVSGFEIRLVLVLSVIISILFTFIFNRLVLFGIKLGFF